MLINEHSMPARRSSKLDNYQKSDCEGGFNSQSLLLSLQIYNEQTGETNLWLI